MIERQFLASYVYFFILFYFRWGGTDKEETVIGQVKTDNKTEEKATDGTKPKQARRHRFQMKQWRCCPPAR